MAISEDAAALVAYARQRWADVAGALGLLQWVLAALECSRAVVATVAPGLGDLDQTQRSLFALVMSGDIGRRIGDDALLAGARADAARRGEREVTETALVRTILLTAGFPLGGEAAPAPPTAADPATEPAILDTLGVDLTRAARAGRLGPVIGRDAEIERVIETLCRRTKRNPALLGPAGVGKTAIIEGLAQRVAAGAVPAPLRDARIVLLSAAAIVAGCRLVGEVEGRMLALLREASAADVILFFDEAHTLVGAGAGGRGGGDLANIVKPALARGEVACIAATTDEEYRLYIEGDAALERRFQPIRVQELTPEATLSALAAVRDSLARAQGVTVPEAQLAWIVSFAGQYLRNRHFPDKAIDILEQCAARGVADGKTTLAQADVETVARRMVGMPQDLGQRLIALRAALTAQGLLPPETIDALLKRLAVTLRGFDLRAARPNAVLLLLGAAAAQSEPLAATIADGLYGDAARVVTLDWARFARESDLTMLFGSPPGYVGYQGRLPLHQVQQMPWCVLRCENVQAAHPAALEALTQALHEGYLTLADGKRVFFSDAIVLLAAEARASASAPLGFGAAGAPDSPHARAARLLGAALPRQVDLICDALHTGDDARRQWLRDCLLAELRARFRPLGVQVCVDASVIAWLLERGHARLSRAEWERLVDEHLCPAIIPHLPAVRPPDDVRVRLTVECGRCVAKGEPA